MRLVRQRRIQIHLFVAATASLLLASCAQAPPAVPDSGTVWGYVELVPREGGAAAGGGYGDRRLSTVKRFDYSHPRFAVVVVPTASSRDESPVELVIGESASGARIEPTFSATTPGTGLQIRNATRRPRIVSIPANGALVRIAPGESTRVSEPPVGESPIHLLGENSSASEVARIWVANGRLTEVTANGRFTLRGLQPGLHQITAWHPRLPPAPVRNVHVSLGGVHRIDMEIGVGLAPSEAQAPR